MWRVVERRTQRAAQHRRRAGARFVSVPIDAAGGRFATSSLSPAVRDVAVGLTDWDAGLPWKPALTALIEIARYEEEVIEPTMVLNVPADIQAVRATIGLLAAGLATALQV